MCYKHVARKKYDKIPTEILILGIDISFDMGQQKRCTGKLYDSLSEHLYKIGCRTGENFGLSVKYKKCSICRTANQFRAVVAEHNCVIDWIGASLVMKAGVALEMLTNLYHAS